MQYGLCDETWDKKEREVIRRVAESGHYSMGEEVRRYEEAFAEKFGTKYARKSIFHNFANIRSIKQAIKHDFRNSTFGTRVFFMFFNQVNRQFS